ncbi:hypothetical protein NP7_10545 (plasmid) [Moraxella osloensis]|uniref:Uncharacterized protein n=1 Tax=Faucicola osloensis TaxID=34062 RepID=A0A2D2LXP0_FAUOS|nr:hypothetical protein NP7_10545 [Moraxella osloensis]
MVVTNLIISQATINQSQAIKNQLAQVGFFGQKCAGVVDLFQAMANTKKPLKVGKKMGEP